MSQVSILAIDISQVVDSTGISGGDSTGASNSNAEFSHLMAKHQQNKSGNNSQASGKESHGNVATKSNIESQPVAEKNANDNSGEDHAIDTEMLTSSTAHRREDNVAGNSAKLLAQGEAVSANEQQTTGLSIEELAQLGEAVDGQQNQAKLDIAAELLAFIKAVDEVSTERKEVVPLIGKVVPVTVPDTIISDEVAVKLQALQEQILPLQDGESADGQDSQEIATHKALAQAASAKQQAIQEQILPSQDGESADGKDSQEKASHKALAQAVSAKQSADSKIIVEGKVNNSEPLDLSATDSDETIVNSQVMKAAKNAENKAAQMAESLPRSPSPILNRADQQALELAAQIRDSQQSTDALNILEQAELTKASGQQKAVVNMTAEPQLNTSDKPDLSMSTEVKQAKENNNTQSPVAINSQQPLTVQDAASNSTEMEPPLATANSTEHKTVERKTSDGNVERVINQSTASQASPSKSDQQDLSQQHQSQQSAPQLKSTNSEQMVIGKENAIEQMVDKLTADKLIADTLINEMPTKSNQAHHASTIHSAGSASIIAGEELAMAQTAAKAQADSVAVQSSKTAINIQNETISIYRKDFSSALKDKVMVMINQKIKQLDIRLDPPELGSMQVRVNLQNEQATVNFIVQNQQAKEAIEQNIHKLKDMLSESGVDVGDTNIEQQDRQSDNQGELAGQGQGHITDADEQAVIEQSMSFSGQNLYKASATGVDYYA